MRQKLSDMKSKINDNDEVLTADIKVGNQARDIVFLPKILTKSVSINQLADRGLRSG